MKNHSFLKSFKHALNGLITMVKNERNFKIELTIGILVILLGFLFRISVTEWIAILIACMVVLALECLNSALEQVVNLSSPDYHILAKHAKDFAAAGVLLASIFAAVIGMVIFLPYLLTLF